MSPEQQLQRLQPPPEVAALGTPDDVMLLTRHLGPAGSPVARALSDWHLTVGSALTLIATLLLIGSFFDFQSKNPSPLLPMICGGSIAGLMAGGSVL